MNRVIEDVDPEKLKDNPYQPRSSYSPRKVDEIASSIEQNGLLEIPLGRRVNGDIELAFGHVRKRSCIKLKKRNPNKFPTMPVEIRDLSDHEMAVFALEENLKRTDITPIDLARSVAKYFEVFPDTTETDLAKKLVMTQGHVSNMRRVMKLPKEVLDKIDEGRITFTMGRELLILDGLSAPGKNSRYSRKEQKYVEIPRDTKWLMLEAVRRIIKPDSQTSMYGSYPCSVDGMQKAISATASDNFKPLGTGSDYRHYGEEVLFDIAKAGCKECKSMLKTHPTKSHICMWCTNPKCWEKHQKKHKEQKAAEAKKKMEQDILARVAASESERQAKPGISQEISVPEPVVDQIPEEDRETARARIEHGCHEICKTCLNVATCDGTGVRSVEGTGEDKVLACDSYMRKQDAKKVREKATVKVPAEVIQLAKEKAGSRGEILDLNELRVGSYGDYLKQGYVLLDRILETIDNPKECLETCTKGFHYAFDSRERPSWREEPENEVSYICTDPKCLAQKKAAHTRALNAHGQAKKKAEVAAIKQAVAETVSLDHGRMKVVLLKLIKSDRSYYSGETDAMKWFQNKLGIEPQKGKWDTYDREKTELAIVNACDKISEQELAQLIIEYTLTQLTYTGDVKSYKIQTTEALHWLSVKIPQVKVNEKPGSGAKESSKEEVCV
jgi:ParB/RepB/Spo0J family partition protein